MHKQLAILLLSAPTMLSLACGEGTVDSSGIEGFEQALEAPSDYAVEPTSQASGALAAAVAQHPDFAQLSAYSWTRAGQIFGAYATLDADLLDEEYQRAALCQQHADPAGCYDELRGVDVTLGVSAAAAAAGQAIVSDLGLSGLSPNSRVALFLAAQDVHEASGGAGGSPALIPSVLGDGIACDADCKDTLVDSLSVVHAGVLMAASTDDGGDGGGGIWVMVATAAIAVIDKYIECLFDPDCHPWPFTDPDQNECNDDGDCPNTQYCWKGPLGVGENECRDKKSVGEPCSRDGKCLSDCCKFNLWDFGSTCRAANECN